MTTLTNSHIFVGDATNTAQDVAMTGDVTISNTGATTIKSNVALTGNPTAVTPAQGDSSPAIANTSFVQRAFLLALLPGYISGCLVTNNATTPNTKVDIAAGAASTGFSNNTAYIQSAGYTVDLGTSGALNQLDTGSLAANTWYHIYVVAAADGSNVGGVASLSVTTPVAPGGGTYPLSRRVGSIRTDGSAHILPFTAAYCGGGATEVFWSASVLDVSTTTLGTSSTTFALSAVLPTGVSCEANTQYFVLTASLIFIRSLFQPDEAPSGTAAPIYTIGSSGGGSNVGGGHSRVRTDTSAQIAMRANVASTNVKLATLGYVDFRAL